MKIRNFRIKDSLIVIFIVILTVPAIIPLIKSGFFHFSDEAHLANLYEMYRSIISGQFPPRLAPDMSYGFGYPLFNFYYPMPYYLGIFLYFLDGSYINSFKIIVLVTTLLSGVFMYGFLRNHADWKASFIGALVYTYTPYRAVDLYVRGALGEIFSFMFFPLIGIFVYKLAYKSSIKNVAFLATITALFILSHNLSPFLILPWFLVYFLIINKEGRRGIVFFGLSLILAFAISSYWLAPALIESVLLKTQPQFNFYDHYPLIRQLIYSKWGYGASLPGIGDDISFQLGFANILIVVFVIYLFIKRGMKFKFNLLLTFSLISLFLVLFLMNIRSRVIWEILPITNFIQFPWRLLMLTTFITSFMVIFLKNRWLLLFLTIALVFSVNYFKPSEYFYPSDNYFLNRYFANQSTKGETKTVSEEYLGWFEDYAILPKWVETRADFLPVERIQSADVQINNLEKVNPSTYIADIYSSSGGTIVTYIYYFPGWTAYLDGKIIETQIGEKYGNMLFRIPAGSYTFELKWEETNLRKSFDIITGIGLLTVAAMLFIKKYEKKI